MRSIVSMMLMENPMALLEISMVLMENRKFDHAVGKFDGVDGKSKIQWWCWNILDPMQTKFNIKARVFI